MEDKGILTKELYGVFRNDGKFEIYYHTVVDNDIDCLFDAIIPCNTIIREELGLFNSPLVVYNPKETDNKKTIYWLDGRFFIVDGKFYKAVRLDILLNEFLGMNSYYIKEETLPRLERVMNKKIKDNPQISKNIWLNMAICEDDIIKKDDIHRSKSYMDKSFVGNFDKLKDKDGMIEVAREHPKIINVSKKDNQIVYYDTGTNEYVYDTYSKNNELLNRKYYNSRSKSLLQIYFQDENVYYLCGIKEKENLLNLLFYNDKISTSTCTTHFYKKKQRIRKEMVGVINDDK